MVLFLDEKKFELCATEEQQQASSTKGFGTVVTLAKGVNPESLLENGFTADQVHALENPPTRLHPKVRIGIRGFQVSGVMAFCKNPDSSAGARRDGEFIGWDLTDENSKWNFEFSVKRAAKKARERTGFQGTIALFADGARWHVGNDVVERLRAEKIDLLILPSHSPDLMPLDFTGWRLFQTEWKKKWVPVSKAPNEGVRGFNARAQKIFKRRHREVAMKTKVSPRIFRNVRERFKKVSETGEYFGK